MNLEKTKAALRECIHACHTRGPGPRIGQLEEALAECESESGYIPVDLSQPLELVRDPSADLISLVRGGVERAVITGEEYRIMVEDQKRIDAKIAAVPTAPELPDV